MNRWFTSDTHFGHSNIIKYCNRPFSTVEEMDGKLIHLWNSVVAPNDEVYHLGDFSFKGSKAHVESILNRLNGQKFLIYGNHDQTARQVTTGFAWKKDYYELREAKNVEPGLNWEHPKIVLCHYAMRVWNGSHRGSWMLYGHSHGTLPDDPNALSFDVGVDCHNFLPINVNQVVKIMATKTYKPVDHHGTPESEATRRFRVLEEQ